MDSIIKQILKLQKKSDKINNIILDFKSWLQRYHSDEYYKIFDGSKGRKPQK